MDFTRISKSAGEKIVRAAIAYENSQRSSPQTTKSLQIPQRVAGRFYNADTVAAPAYAIMAVTGVQTLSSGEVLPKIGKPSTTFRRSYLVNGSAEVAASSAGSYQDAEIIKVAYDTGSPALDEGWGPKAGQWTLTKNYPETCLVIGVADSTKKLLLARVHPIDRILGKLAGSISQGQSATVNIWGGAGGSETVIASLTLSARDWLMKSGSTAIASGKKVVVTWINGIAYIEEAECA